MHKSNYTEEITLDLACRENVVTVRAKQNDNIKRTLDVTLFDSRDGSYWYQPEGTAEIRVQRPDGVLVTAECMKMHLGSEGEEVTHYGVYLTSDMLAAAGRARADIRVMQETGREGAQKTEIISAGFVLEVIPSARGSIGSGYVSDTVNIEKITASEYAKIPHSTNTLYIVIEQDGTVKQYLGDVEISGNGNSGGNAPSEAVVYCDPAPETVIAQVNCTSIDLSDPTLWEQGAINEDGSDKDSAFVIRTKELIPINHPSMGLIFTSSVKNGKAREYAVVCFDENQSPIINDTWNWTKSGTTMYFDSGVHFVRIEDSYAQAATCLPDDILTANLMILEE